MSVINVVKKILDENPVYLDTETTGLEKTDQVVEIAIIDNLGSILLNTLIKPTIPIPPAAESIHGISDKQVAGAPTFARVLPELQNILASRTLVVYNAKYDVRMLQQSAQAVNLKIQFPIKIHCAMELFAEYRGQWDPSRQHYKWFSLGNAATHCKIKIPPNIHRAAADAELTRQIMLYMAKSA